MSDPKVLLRRETLSEPARIRAALAGGADVESRSAIGGDTPLVILCHRLNQLYPDSMDSLEAIRLLCAAGADVNSVNARGQTPVTGCIECRAPSELKLLLEFGAQANPPNLQVINPLEMAGRSGLEHCVAVLLEAGADLHRLTPAGADNGITVKESIYQASPAAGVSRVIQAFERGQTTEAGLSAAPTRAQGLTPSL